MTYQQLLARYKRRHKHLVEPKQGFDSLVPHAWLAYSMGRKRGFLDLGTYARKPGDHGTWPSHAFDLGRKDRFLLKGWNYLKARRLAKMYWRYHEPLGINYVILGTRLISRERPYWHKLTTGDTSHMFHIHVSAIYVDA